MTTIFYRCGMKRLICFLLSITCLFGLGFCRSEEHESGLTIYFLDVGQGDAILVQCDGMNMMIDGGDRSHCEFLYSFLKNDLQLEHFDYVISTHPHEDHVYGLCTILSCFSVGEVYSPVTKYDQEGFKDFVKLIHKKKLSLLIPNRGDSFQLGSATVTFLSSPDDGFVENDCSLIVRLTYGDNSYLFMGDAETPEEETLLANNADISSNVIKIGHHGSDTSTSEALVKAVQPEYAIISVGKDNAFGHPSDTTIQKLQSLSMCTVYRTDFSGTIILTSDGKDIHIVSEKKREKL